MAAVFIVKPRPDGGCDLTGPLLPFGLRYQDEACAADLAHHHARITGVDHRDRTRHPPTMKTALSLGTAVAMAIASTASAQAPAKKPSLAEERINGYQNPLNQGAKSGAQSPALAAKAGAADPVQGHVFTLWELKAAIAQLDGQIVRVRIQPTIIRPEQLPSGDYRVFVQDALRRAQTDQWSFADIYFPAEGIQKMDLLRKTTRGELSFWVSVSAGKFTAVGRTLKRDLNGATTGYVW